MLIEVLKITNGYFNPRSREGSDQTLKELIIDKIEFQSTLPRRERHNGLAQGYLRPYFNPRSREGSDGGAGG